MAKKALITGASGLLGRQVLTAFREAGWDVVGTGLSRTEPPTILRLDLANVDAVLELLDSEKPQVVVHCAANRFPDKCDADQEGARALNVKATRFLARSTSSRNILLIYISTDYVFSGLEGEAPYETDRSTHPTNFYGRTKLEGEEAALEETKASRTGIILRVPVLYGKAETPGESAVNVLMDTVWKAQEQNIRIEVDDWAQRYPTNTEDVGRVCKDVATKYLDIGHPEHVNLPRILQFSSEDRLTKYEICQLMADILGLPLGGLMPNRQGNDPAGKVQRPYDTHLSTKALKDIAIPVWAQAFEGWWRKEAHAFRH